jgi:hypothetical protein
MLGRTGLLPESRASRHTDISMFCAGLGVTILPQMAVREHLAAGMLRRPF